MSRIFWDTNLFIYLIEDYGAHSRLVADIARRMLVRNDQLFASTFSLAEVLVRPIETGNQTLALKFEEVFERRVALIPFDRRAARMFARIRADRSIRGPDAIQLACAAAEEVDLFVTNDDRLAGKLIAGINFVTSMKNGLALLGG